MKVLVTTRPFGDEDKAPLQLLYDHGCRVNRVDPGKKMTADDLLAILPEYDVLLAGTHEIPNDVIERCPNLRLIARVGAGLDNVDVAFARSLGIEVTYTPEAPADSVAELTLCMILDLLRYVTLSDKEVRAGHWNRRVGGLLKNQTVGIIGLGRIGTRVAKLLEPFGCAIIANDVRPIEFAQKKNIPMVDKDELYRNADVVTLHVPLTEDTRNLVNVEVLRKMKQNAILINTARGPVVNEHDLFDALSAHRIQAAAIDVFEEEPYQGPLIALDNVLLTSHMGACTIESRREMEMRAAKEVVELLSGNGPLVPAPLE
ncbi:MAG: phosphoglycerate dehydrogenase [Planctomycetes bacterium]|nr:phosphoglycerate dehydrogenase [Planctomycetota bacterium]